MVGDFTLPDGRRATTAFQLLAERYLDARYAPEAVAGEIGIAADTIRRIAAELAHAAFEQEITLDIPWTDWAGRRHEKIIGRPVVDACHARHLGPFQRLPDLPRHSSAADAAGHHRLPRRLPLQAAVPAPDSAADQAGRRRPARARRSAAPLSAFPPGPSDLLVDADGTPKRIDKAYSWEAPLAAHGLMHMVIHNAWKGDPYPIDMLFLYMANMGWNSSMNLPATLDMLTERNADGEAYRIPHIIYSDAYFSETVAYADLVLPDTTYLERWDCISLLDRPISDADGAADAIRQPVVKPDRDVRPFQDVLIDLGARLKLPGLRERRRQRQISRALSRLHRQPRAQAGHRHAGGLARRGWRQDRPGCAEPEAARALHREWLLLASRTGARSAITIAMPTRPISTGPCRWASSTSRSR